MMTVIIVNFFNNSISKLLKTLEGDRFDIDRWEDDGGRSLDANEDSPLQRN